MEILKYEFIKLGKKKLFLVISFLMLVGNLLVLYTSQKHTKQFFYVHEQKEVYEAFLNGDYESDIDNYYQQDMEAQKKYIASYPVFIDGMADRATQMQGTVFYERQDSYVYRNLIKSCEEYETFSGIELTVDNCFGVRELVGYNGSLLFVLTFLAILIYYVIFYERDRNLLLLLKGNRRGHMPVAAAKFMVSVLSVIIFTFLLEGSNIFFLSWMYGYGNLGRNLQSVSVFRNCTYVMTVGELLLAVLLIHIVIAIVLVCVLFCIGMLFKNAITAAVVSAIIFGLEFLFSIVFSISGTFSSVKTVNPFYCWNIDCVLGEYYNLNIFDRPVGKNVLAVLVAIILSLLLPAVGIFSFHRDCQVKKESRLESIGQWIRRRTGFLSRKLNLLYYEFYKMLIQQKKGIVLVLLIFWGVYETIGAMGTEYYSAAEEASYHAYINRWGGPITEDTFTFVETEEKYQQELWQSYAEADYVEGRMIQAELELWEEGLRDLKEQLALLEEKPGNITEKYLVDEKAYLKLWQDKRTDIGLWFVGSVVLLFLISSIYTMDEKKRMVPLIRSTRNGRRSLNRSRNLCAAVSTGVVLVVMEFPRLLQYYRIDHFESAMHKLCNFTQAEISAGITLGSMLVCVFLLKGVSFYMVCVVGIKLSKIMKNEMVSMLTGIGLVGIVAFVMYWLGWDFNMLFVGN
ncbi:MAG: ABC transporter permease subunit [Roseburia sp.]